MQWLATVTYSDFIFTVQANDVLSNAVWLFVVWEKQRHPVARVHRSEPVQWSEWQQSHLFIYSKRPPHLFSPHKAPSITK